MRPWSTLNKLRNKASGLLTTETEFSFKLTTPSQPQLGSSSRPRQVEGTGQNDIWTGCADLLLPALGTNQSEETTTLTMVLTPSVAMFNDCFPT